MFRTISMKQLEAMLDDRARRENGGASRSGDFVLLDVRESEEYQYRHLQGALNLPYAELEYLADYGEKVAGLPKGKTIVVYCSQGSHSMMAARILDRMGYNVINTSGGLSYYRGRHLTGER